MNLSSANITNHRRALWSDSELGRWGVCLLVVLALHIGAFATFEMWKTEADHNALLSAAVMIDLPPLPGPAGDGAGGESSSRLRTLHPTQAPKPRPQVRNHTHFHPLVRLRDKIDQMLKPPPKETELEKPAAVLPSAKPISSAVIQPDGIPSASEAGNAGSGGAGGVGGNSSVPCCGNGNSDSVGFGEGGPKTWEGLLLAQLQEHKRYPPSARERGEEGIAYLRFALNRAGKVLSFSLEKSSGFSDLDQETLDLIQRSQPLPPPPAAVKGNVVELVVPVKFQLQQEE